MTIHHFAALLATRRQSVIFTRRTIWGFLQARAQESRFPHTREQGIDRPLGDAQAPHLREAPHEVVSVDFPLGDHVQYAEFEQSAANLRGPVVHVEVVVLPHWILPGG